MKQKGYTLIELLVTMGIIAVLTGMAVFNFNQARMRARDVQRKSDLSQLKSALELYKNDNYGKYPADAINFQQILKDGEYIKELFADPKSGWDQYIYESDFAAKTYTITACLENKTDTTTTENLKCPSSDGAVYQVTNP